MVIEDSFELFTCAFHIWKVDFYWCYLFLISLFADYLRSCDALIVLLMNFFG